MLIVIGGLPGTGKTTIAKALAARQSAAYIRIDEIEHALQPRLGSNMGPEGYIIAYAIAASNLRIGNRVVADCVNPVPESRLAWRDVALQASLALLEVEVICSDIREHRRRVENRAADIAGFTVPGWESVQRQEYAPWTGPRMILDTALLSPCEAIEEIEAALCALVQPNKGG